MATPAAAARATQAALQAATGRAPPLRKPDGPPPAEFGTAGYRTYQSLYSQWAWDVPSGRKEPPNEPAWRRAEAERLRLGPTLLYPKLPREIGASANAHLGVWDFHSAPHPPALRAAALSPVHARMLRHVAAVQAQRAALRPHMLGAVVVSERGDEGAGALVTAEAARERERAGAPAGRGTGEQLARFRALESGRGPQPPLIARGGEGSSAALAELRAGAAAARARPGLDTAALEAARDEARAGSLLAASGGSAWALRRSLAAPAGALPGPRDIVKAMEAGAGADEALAAASARVAASAGAARAAQAAQDARAAAARGRRERREAEAAAAVAEAELAAEAVAEEARAAAAAAAEAAASSAASAAVAEAPAGEARALSLSRRPTSAAGFRHRAAGAVAAASPSPLPLPSPTPTATPTSTPLPFPSPAAGADPAPPLSPAAAAALAVANANAAAAAAAGAASAAAARRPASGASAASAASARSNAGLEPALALPVPARAPGTGLPLSVVPRPLSASQRAATGSLLPPPPPPPPPEAHAVTAVGAFAFNPGPGVTLGGPGAAALAPHAQQRRNEVVKVARQLSLLPPTAGIARRAAGAAGAAGAAAAVGGAGGGLPPRGGAKGRGLLFADAAALSGVGLGDMGLSVRRAAIAGHLPERAPRPVVSSPVKRKAAAPAE
jgi:hypothetical protein